MFSYLLYPPTNTAREVEVFFDHHPIPLPLPRGTTSMNLMGHSLAL